MASNFQKTIEFKVKRTDLNRAVEKLFKDLKKIDLTVDEINKGTKILNKELKQSTVEIKKAEKATVNWGKAIKRAVSDTNNLSNSLLKVIKRLTGVGTGGGGRLGITKLLGELGLFDAGLRKLTGRGLPQFRKRVEEATVALGAFGAAHLGAIAAVSTGAIVLVRGTQVFYNLGKATRQAVVSFNELRAAYGKGGFKGLFPAGSILGGNKTQEDIKTAVAEAKKLEKAAEKTQKQYKLVATGLNKSREQLSKLKKIQDQLLSSSKGYENVTKKVLKLEKEITKEERKRANINRRLDWKKDAMKLVGGRLGAIKLGAGALGGLAGGVFADDGIKRISAALGHQVSLFKVVTVSASKFFQGLKAVDQGARKGAATLDKYGRTVVGLVREHSRLIQTTVGLAAGLDAVARFAPTAYNIGKGFRQLTFDIGKATQAIKKYGLEAGILSFAEKGSIAGKRFRNLMAGQPGALKHPSFEKELKEWGGASGTSGIRSQIEGLTKIGEVLNNNKKIQENINASVRGPYMQAAIAVKKLQFQYNLELAKTRLIQSAVTADIWIAKRGLSDMVKLAQGIAGALKGLGGGILGGVLGGAKNLATGKAGPIGQAAVVIGISDAVKRLSQSIPFVSQAWKDNIQVFATWTKRVTEGLAAATIAHGVFAKAISAAQWTTGAISGFMRWEKAAMLTFHRVNRGRIQLDKDMARWFDKGAAGQRRNNPLTNVWDKIVGGRRQEIAEIYNQRKPTKDPMIVRMERALKTSQEMLQKTDLSAANYEQRQQRVLNLERAINAEMAKRKGVLESMTQLTGQSSFVGKQNVRNRMAMNRGHKFSGFGDWSADQEKLSAARKADAERERRLHQVLAINKKLEASGKRQLSTWNLLSEEEKERRQSAWDLAAFRETSIRDRRKTAQNRLGNWRNIRKQRGDRMRENLMLGAGFPLLFGGGAGAVGGGVIGAGLQAKMGSKGFGMQILFSALGQQIDAFVGKTNEFARALKKPTESIAALIKGAGLADTPLGDQIKQLEELGLKASAAALATRSLNARLGEEGMRKLKSFSDEWLKFSNEMEIAKTRLMAFISGPLSALVKVLNFFNEKEMRDQAQIEAMKDTKEKFGPRPRMRHPLDIGGFLRSLNETNDSTAREQFRDKRQDFHYERLMKGANAPSDEMKRRIEQMRKMGLQTTKDQITLEKERSKLNDRELEVRAKVLELNRVNLEIQFQQQELETAQALGGKTDKIKQKLEELGLSKELIEAQLANLNKVDVMFEQIGATIRDGMVQAIEDAIDGTKSLGENVASVARQIARIMMNYAVTSSLKWMGLPGMAAGGPVSGGKSYLVGERGPEIFKPNSSGTIIPNNKIGGSSNTVVVNVDATGGSEVQGDEPSSQQLGRLLGAAVQAELIKQSRPGGILSR